MLTQLGLQSVPRENGALIFQYFVFYLSWQPSPESRNSSVQILQTRNRYQFRHLEQQTNYFLSRYHTSETADGSQLRISLFQTKLKLFYCITKHGPQKKCGMQRDKFPLRESNSQPSTYPPRHRVVNGIINNYRRGRNAFL